PVPATHSADQPSFCFLLLRPPAIPFSSRCPPRPFLFFQAEAGIRVFHVTGVQTCALPISAGRGRGACSCPASPAGGWAAIARSRSEERRVGKEWRSRGAAWGKEKRSKEIRDLKSGEIGDEGVVMSWEHGSELEQVHRAV